MKLSQLWHLMGPARSRRTKHKPKETKKDLDDNNPSVSATMPLRQLYQNSIFTSQTEPANPLQKRRSNVPGLVCAFMASVTTGGTIYAFGIYGDDLKKSLGLTQLQLDGISATFFISGLFSWAPGMVVDRQGMRFSMMLGGLSGVTSTLLYWAVARKFFPIPHAALVPLLGLLAILMSLSCGLIIGSIFKLTLLCGGPRDKGSAVGIAKGFVGLGAGVYATIFQALRTPGESALDFLPVIAFFFVTNAFLPALFLLPTKSQSCPSLIVIETTPLHFRVIFLSLLVLGCLIVWTSISDILYDTNRPHPTERNYRMVFTIIVLWWGPILSILFFPKEQHPKMSTITSTVSFTALHVHNGDEQHNHNKNNNTDEETDPSSIQAMEHDALLNDSDRLDDYFSTLVDNIGESTNEETKNNSATTSNYLSCHNSITTSIVAIPKKHCNSELHHQHPESTDCSLPEMLLTPAAWLMLWTCAILVGSGTCKTNNMGQMVEALGFAEAVNPATLAIFSVAQMASRIVTGIVSEKALRWQLFGSSKGIPRPFFLVVASAISCVAHIMLAVSTSQIAFVIGCTIAALAFGMAWPLMVLIVGDIFGLEHHGANYMFYDGFTKAVGTLALSTFVAGTVYENHVVSTVSDNEEDMGGASLCYGPECFRNTHLIVAGLTLTGLAASYVLQRSTTELYHNRNRRS